MSSEDAELRPLDALDAELLRHVCDAAPLSDAAAQRLAADPVLRDEVAAEAALADELRGALRPVALTPQVESKIWARIEADQAGSGKAGWMGWRALVGAAVAAVLLFGVLVPQGRQPVVEDEPRVVLTEAELAEIANALAALRWDSGVAPTLDELSEDVTAVSQRIERESTEDSLLPWDTEDDWDLPPAQDA